MPKRDRPSRPAEPASRDDPLPISRRGWLLLIFAAILPVVVHVTLFWAGVPLGKPGTITYPYSEFASLRAQRVPQMIAIAALLGAAILLVADSRRLRRGLGYGLAALGVVGVGLWPLVSPPAWQRQQLFNMLSPSHDGAFFLEAEHVNRVGVGEYARSFAARAARSPEEMRGTRVISNPPGTTLFIVALERMLSANPSLERRLGEMAVDDPTLPAEVKRRAGRALAVSLAFVAFWLAGAGLIFLAASRLVSCDAALAVAIIGAISPMTVLFTPGKDPAQLATVGLFLCMWIAAMRCRSGWRLIWSLAAGAALALGAFVGLVHFWIAGCAILASWLAIWRRGSRGRDMSAGRRGEGASACVGPETGLSAMFLVTLAAAAGLCLGAALLYVWLGFDIVGSTLAVARAQAEVTRGPTAMPVAWQTLGVPLFLLFGGVGTLAAWGQIVSRNRGGDRDAFGRCLLLVTLGVMLATIGFTNLETPRLWIPFALLLVLGGGLRLDAALPAGRTRARILAAIVALQVTAAGVQWSLMDMREAELRLKVDESGGARFFD